MKHKLTALCMAALLLLTCGCSLAQENPGTIAALSDDRLVGVLVTTEYLDLFDMEAWLNDNINKLNIGRDTEVSGDTSKYQGRIYAELVEETLTREDGSEYNHDTYKFPEELNGHLFMSPTMKLENGEDCVTSIVSGAVCDVRSNMISGDAGTSIELSATIYFDPYAVKRETYLDEETNQQMEHVCFYANPVYQTPEGDVYVTSGMGSSYEVEEELGLGTLSGSVYFTEKFTSTENGVTAALENKVTVNYQGVKLAKEICVLEMSSSNQLLRKISYTPDMFPKELAVSNDAAYVIVETHSTVNEEETLNRQVCTVNAEDETFEVFVPAEDGFAAKQMTNVVTE